MHDLWDAEILLKIQLESKMNVFTRYVPEE